MLMTRRHLLGSAAILLVASPARAEPLTWALKPGTWKAPSPPNIATPIFAANGQLPAPVVRARQGEPLNLRVLNALDSPMGLSWHGLRLAGPQVGNPLTEPPLAPGALMDMAIAGQEPGTFLLQPRAVDMAANPAARGLASVLVVEEREPPAAEADLVLALDDWPASPLTINGQNAPLPLTAAPGARLRLRLVNQSTTQNMVIGLPDLKPLIIAIDSQPCQAFEPVRANVPMAPGTRFDVLVHLPQNVPHDTPFANIVLRGAVEVVAARIMLAGDPLPPRPHFAGLPSNPALPEAIALETAARAELTIAQADAKAPVLFNGVAGTKESKPLVSVAKGAAVSLAFVNKTNQLQPIRLHGHVMRQLHALDDGWEPYWRDTVVVAPGKTLHVAFVADNPGRWMVESAVAPWSAAGLWTWFEVK